MRPEIRNTTRAALDNIPGIKLIQVGRRHKLNANRQLPAVIIYTDNESQELISQTPRRFEHTVELKITFYTKTTRTDLGETALDELIDQTDPRITQALEAHPDIRVAIPADLEIDADGEADADYLTAERTFLVKYETKE